MSEGDKSSLHGRNSQSSHSSNSSGGRNGGRHSSSRGVRGRNTPIPVPRTHFGVGLGGSSSERKRRRDGDPGAGPSMSPQQQQQQHQRVAVPPPVPFLEGMGDFPCGLCQMTFDSDKSLAGHMRMHPDRPWRGMHPPPTFTRAEFADVAYLLNPEHDVDDDNEDNNIDDGRGGCGGPRGNYFKLPDLNKTPSPPTNSS